MRVLIADKFEPFGIDELKRAGCEVLYEPDVKGPALARRVRETDCDVLVVRSTQVPREALDAASKLKLVVRAGAGVDTIDVPAATVRNIRVCNCPGMNSVAVAELTIGLMIALDRRIVDETSDLRRGIWKKKEYSKARGLKGRTLGIVGLGRIGREVARRAAAFEMKLLYTDVLPQQDLEERLAMRRVPLEMLLQQSDFVTLHVPGGPATRHLIGREQLALMRPTAFIINCSRGGVIDEQALAEALESGKLAGAALDVWEVEPAEPEGEFKDPTGREPRVYGTHHVGASTEQAQLAVAEETVRIVRTFMNTGKALNCVNLAPAGI
jgi:D-3-phosphoglycerate dehydrogenase